MHYFLSPHPDDAVLSCGGLIYQLAQAGEEVTVFTVMSGDLPAHIPLNPFIQEHIERWQLGPNPAAKRRIEDRAAIEFLGASVEFGPFPDCLYRAGTDGSWLYTDLKKLFGPVDPRDPVLQQASVITNRIKHDMTLYIPLGVGNHVDHQLVRDIIVAWKISHPEVAIFLYEEYPYTIQGFPVINAARSVLKVETQPVIHHLRSEAIDAKIRAIACYESQISTFWSDLESMARAVRQAASGIDESHYAERLWQPI
jgi:LmbE family N-acetylglucosaminyl deacetylase